jgi:ABC-type bacteriocin/lantibiotic exporter with double-glycine peptidase domain
VEATPEVHTGQSDPGRLTGTLALEHVTFRYRERGPVILDDVSLHAAPGEFIALVGPSGSGKSTLMRLLLGLETPEAGAILYDGQELSRLDVRAVRRQIGSVLQQSTLMAGTIFEHIAGGALITHEDAWEAVRAAGLAEDIAAFPMGLHTFVSEGGSNLSGGQRQRLLIARALVGKPTIVLFDEATSALDNRTQAVVTASLERLQVTRVVIAHRLSTIQAADRIYVLDGGRIVQQGSFADLAQQPGLFAQLMARQESADNASW